jgi:hypothetical protein
MRKEHPSTGEGAKALPLLLLRKVARGRIWRGRRSRRFGDDTRPLSREARHNRPCFGTLPSMAWTRTPRRLQAHRSTTTISYWSAVGGKPVSNFALATASRLPKRAAVAGTWNRSLLMTSSMTPEVRSGLS